MSLWDFCWFSSAKCLLFATRNDMFRFHIGLWYGGVALTTLRLENLCEYKRRWGAPLYRCRTVVPKPYLRTPIVSGLPACPICCFFSVVVVIKVNFLPVAVETRISCSVVLVLLLRGWLPKCGTMTYFHSPLAPSFTGRYIGQTSCEIIQEAKASIMAGSKPKGSYRSLGHVSSPLKTIHTRRPFTPKVDSRTLFGGSVKADHSSRPSSTFR